MSDDAEMIEVVRVFLRANMHDGQTGGLVTMKWDTLEAEVAELAVEAFAAGREADRRRITELETALANANLELGRTIIDYARPSIPWHDCEREGPDAGPDPEHCAVCAYAARGEALIADALSVLAAEHTQGAG